MGSILASLTTAPASYSSSSCHRIGWTFRGTSEAKVFLMSAALQCYQLQPGADLAPFCHFTAREYRMANSDFLHSCDACGNNFESRRSF